MVTPPWIDDIRRISDGDGLSLVDRLRNQSLDDKENNNNSNNPVTIVTQDVDQPLFSTIRPPTAVPNSTLFRSTLRSLAESRLVNRWFARRIDRPTRRTSKNCEGSQPLNFVIALAFPHQMTPIVNLPTFTTSPCVLWNSQRCWVGMRWSISLLFVWILQLRLRKKSHLSSHL